MRVTIKKHKQIAQYFRLNNCRAYKRSASLLIRTHNNKFISKNA